MNWIKYKKIYFAVSIFLILVSIFSLFKWGLKTGLDFKGGSIVEISFENEISTEDLIKKLSEDEIVVSSIQVTGEGTYLFRMASVKSQEKKKFDDILETFGIYEEVRFENVGPSFGPELIKKTVYAIFLATLMILIWIAIQFKNLKYGVSAILAMLHDSFILVGSFSLFGYFYNVEIDFLFITALLTTLSFSVHDTIVVFDRIRETQRKQGGDISDLANNAITKTLVRSLNNSFTIMFMLLALILMGGSTIKGFATALLIGTILGTYSSPFVAVPLLVVFYRKKKV